jgi:hypothetical protein
MDTNGAMVWIRESVNVNTIAADTSPTIAVTKAGVIYVSYQTAGAVNGTTSSGGTDLVVLKMAQAPIDAPTALLVNITGTGTTVTISFTPPVSNGGSIITGYTVISSPAGPTGGGAGTSSPITMTGLVVGTTYTFAVAAVNALGTGPAGIARPIDEPPTIITANSPSVGTVFLQWAAPNNNGGQPITQYIVTVLPIKQLVYVSADQTSVTITGLRARTYTFTVTASNANTNSAASVRSSKVGVSEDKSTYKYMLLNTPFTFKVFTAFRII